MPPNSEGTRPKVLFVVLSLDPGGTERLVIQLASALRPRADICVCCLDSEGSWASEIRDLEIPILTMNRKPGFSPAISIKIAREITQRGISIAHCFHYSPFVYTALASRFSRIEGLVYTETGRLTDSSPSPKRRLVNSILARLPGTFVAVSKELRQHMISEGFSAERVGVVYCGIHPGSSPTNRDRAQARKDLGLSSGQAVIGTVARLDPVKNLGSLIDAYSDFRSRLPNSKLVILGDGEERGSLELRARELGVGGDVVFAGRVPDVRSLLPALDLFVNCSVTEGVSLTILEAMAASIPVVATAVGGTPEVVQHEKTGLLVPPNDRVALARALTQAIRDRPRSVELGKAGRDLFEARFTSNRMVQQYLQIYGFTSRGD